MRLYKDKHKMDVQEHIRKVPYLSYSIGMDCQDDLYYLLKPEVVAQDKYLYWPGQVCDSIIFLREGDLEITFIINEKGFSQIKERKRTFALKGLKINKAPSHIEHEQKTTVDSETQEKCSNILKPLTPI